MPVSKKRKKPQDKRKPPRPSRVPMVVEDPSGPMVTRTFNAVLPIAQRELPDLLKSVLPSDIPPGTVLDPMAAADYLHRVRLNLERLAFELAQTYSPAAWLWYTRRTTRAAFRGRLVTTEMSDHALMETLTGLSLTLEDDERLREGTRLAYDMAPSALLPVARMATIAVTLSQVHAWLRRAGKGTSFEVAAADLPEPIEDLDLEQAISVFDSRVDNDHSHWHPTVSRPDYGREPEAYLLLGATTVAADWPELPGWIGPMDKAKRVKLRGHFIPEFFSLASLFDATRAAGATRGTWWDEALPSLIAFLQALGTDASVNSEHAGTNIPTVGYTVRGREYTIEMIDAWLPKLDAPLRELFGDAVPPDGRSVLEVVEGIKGSLWPVRRGPVIRPLGPNSIQIDVYSATQVLQQLITVPSHVGGQLVNATANRLEDEAQRLIDDTPWRPAESLRTIRRRQLQLGGKALTDIDALGQAGSTVLLVSCKNLSYTPEYDAGEYNVVRNARTTIENGVEFWSNIVETLRVNPVGDNYDFSSYERIVGVVVTPHVFFVASDTATSVVAKSSAGVPLPASASLGELQEFLATE